MVAVVAGRSVDGCRTERWPAFLPFPLAILAARASDLSRARAVAAHAADRCRQHPETYVLVWAWILAAQAALVVGDSDEAVAHDAQARLRQLALRTDQRWFLSPNATSSVPSRPGSRS